MLVYELEYKGMNYGYNQQRQADNKGSDHS